MLPRRFHRLRSVLDRRQLDLTVLLEKVHKPHNLSAVLRSCDAVGIFEAHAVAPDRVVKPAEAIAQGTGRWVRLVSHRTIAAACAGLHERGFRIWAAHPGSPGREARDYREVDYTGPTAILFGQEKDGVTDEALELADGRLEIPMEGMVASLNVSVAAALVLFEARRQRQAAGSYEGGPHLPEDLYRTTLFEWAHPVLARMCRRKGVPYPELGEDGEVLGEVPRG
ncbi:MAG: tRNA (guanosine(18)-2'-O)-methyltransferase TrmH [Acidobacteriota bacterium]|jgi:tRNA (guanosine-2'-O-)-methyltransferase